MKIQCYFDNRFIPPSPFIRVTFESKNLNIRKPLSFHIDTGASVTILLDKDIQYLGIDKSKSKKTERKIGEIGESIKTFIIEDTTYSLKLKMEKSLKKDQIYLPEHMTYQNFP